MKDKVPTYEELKEALKLPGITHAIDSIGREFRRNKPKKVKIVQKRKWRSKYD